MKGSLWLFWKHYGCVPILYNTFASASDIVTDGKDGVLVDANTEETFVVKLQELMENKSMREDLRKGRLDKLSKYSPEKVTDLWNKLLMKIERYA